MSDLYWATRPFDYAGQALDRGQVVTLVGVRNDEALVRLGYLRKYEGNKRDLVECAVGGEKFISHDTRIAHHEKRHVARTLDPDEEDRREAREEKMLAQVAPLNLDQTVASRGG